MNISEVASHEARFYETEADRVRCLLCPHGCLIPSGKSGLCRVRHNRDGRLYSLTYGLASSIHPDPIEKKPLFHFLPGTTAISFGSVGCNLSCRHCQNFSISRSSPSEFSLEKIVPEDVVRYAEDCGARSVSWTYNEPTIWHEFTTDASRVAHDAGLKTSYVTNGYINEAPLRELSGLIDAMNIDVKSFTEEFYREICGGHLAPVLETCVLALELGIHIELTYLVIPGHNDAAEEFRSFSEWVVSQLRADVPVHFSAFHPDFKLTDVQRTPMRTMNLAFQTAKKAGLDFVYVGNVYAGDKDDTFCPGCGTLVIQREGFSLMKTELKNGRCANCDNPLNIVV